MLNSPDIESLFEKTLIGDYEDEDAWEAVHTLRRNANREIFERAAAWCKSENPKKRARAVAILCQLRPPDWRDQSYPLVTNLLEHEQDPLVLDAALAALGHLSNPEAI